MWASDARPKRKSLNQHGMRLRRNGFSEITVIYPVIGQELAPWPHGQVAVASQGLFPRLLWIKAAPLSKNTPIMAALSTQVKEKYSPRWLMPDRRRE